MHNFLNAFLFLAFGTGIYAGEMRTWTSSDGAQTFEAIFVDRTDEDVTLLRDDRKELTFPLLMLHDDDRIWLNQNHPIKTEIPEPEAFFDTLKFGDNRELVNDKLAASQIVESSVEGIFQGRTGLNGIYRTTHKIGGLFCYLFFDWDENGQLIEVTLQTENELVDTYVEILKPCWEECIPLIASIHGKPIQHTAMPGAAQLKDDEMLASHLWNLEGGGTVMLGTAKQGLGYQVVVRFTKERIEINKVP